MKKLVVLLWATILFSNANAYRIEWGRTVTINKPVYEDLYIAAGTITINAPIHGDLIVAGGTIYINDTIMKDLLLAGGNIRINGFIADDIRCAGGELTILKNIGGDLVITGGRVDISPSVQIEGGLLISGGEVTANGVVRGEVRSAAGNLIFNGTALQNFDSRCDKLTINGSIRGNSVLAARQIIIGENAGFTGDVRYWNKAGNLNFRQTIQKGRAVYDPTLEFQTSKWYYLEHTSLLGLIWYLATVFIFILLLQYLFSSTFTKAGSTVDHSLFRSLGFGLLFFIAVPVAIVALLVTIIGIPVGLILMMCYILLVLLATVISSLVFANWYNNRFKRNWTYWQITGSAFGTFILVKLVGLTPLLGWLVMILVASVAFGAIVRNINWRRSHKVVMQ